MLFMLIDEIDKITVSSGSGGAGRVSFYKGRGKPSGGDGGRGGDVYAVSDAELISLTNYNSRRVFEAAPGEPGAAFNRTGAQGASLTLRFPRGTELTDLESGEVIDLDSLEQPYLLCRGGNGGWGNVRISRIHQGVFAKANEGRRGETRSFRVVMKLLADIGIIGLPNAGKSSLLNALTAAQAEVAAYPFTTLEPNLGVLSLPYPKQSRLVLADIPGLIEGASAGRGLGTKFLKHIEKVCGIVHCISLESSDVMSDYEVVRNEVQKFNPKLTQKKELVVLTKTDLFSGNLEKIVNNFQNCGIRAISCSVLDDSSLVRVREVLRTVAGG
jgi:GTP-binding protein